MRCKIPSCLIAGAVSVLSIAGAPPQKSPPTMDYGHSVAKVGLAPITAAWGNPIAFSGQVIAFGGKTEELKQADFEKQFTNCLARLARDLGEVRADYSRLLRLNCYLRDDSDRVKAAAYLGRHVPGLNTSLAFVSGRLEHPDAQVAMDAVGLTLIPKRMWSRIESSKGEIRDGRHGKTAGILMPGRRVFISGQAVRADSLVEATRATMKQLGATLKFLELGWQDVVQVKSFLQPMSEVSSVSAEISRFFLTNQAPPQVFVEWTSQVPIEIELVVNGGPAKKDDPLVEYLTPPGMKASPVFSRVVRVNRGKLIFTSSLYGPTDRGVENEIRSIFDELNLSMMVMGADLKHLVKATYYVADNESSRTLTLLRPDYYDPERPPAASKAAVRGVGLPNHRITMDLIGVAEQGGVAP